MVRYIAQSQYGETTQSAATIFTKNPSVEYKYRHYEKQLCGADTGESVLLFELARKVVLCLSVLTSLTSVFTTLRAFVLQNPFSKQARSKKFEYEIQLN